MANSGGIPGKIDRQELEGLADLLYSDGQIDRVEVEFLVELHRRVIRVSPAFEKFCFAAIKRHILSDGVIYPSEANWLRQMIYADGEISDREKKLVRELKGESIRTCVEFETLYAECM